jgi:aminocarboxymuconate-semialdehyde decarboxylase
MLETQIAAAANGIAFVRCAATSQPPRHSHAQSSEFTRVRPTTGSGSRTIDIHAHCAIPQALSLMGLNLTAVGGDNFPVTLDGKQVDQRLAAMDSQHIDMQVLSINPFWYAADVELSRQIINLQNNALADLIGRHKDRFAGLASVALQHPELAAEQLDHAVRRLGLRGALVGGSVEGAELSDPRFHPFWAKAESLGTLIFVHPQGLSDAARRLRGSGGLQNVIGNPLETTVALSHLIFEGTLDRFPGLKICAAHGGGYLPSYAGRFDAGILTFPHTYTVKLKKTPTAYLRDLYYDSLVFTAEGLRHLIAEVGAGRVMLGTDYPYPWTTRAVEHILETPELSRTERDAILGGTAEELLSLVSKPSSPTSHN